MLGRRSKSSLTLVVALSFACSDRQSVAPPTPPVTESLSVSLSPKSDSVLVGASRTFSAQVKNQFGEERPATVSWSVVDASVATISQNGSVVGIAAGSTQIVAAVGAAADTALLLVRPNVTAVTILPNAAQIVLGDSIRFAAAFDQSMTAAELSSINPVWSTSDSSIAYVREDGQLVSMAEGDVEITVSAAGAVGVASARVIRAPVVSVIVSPAVASLSPGQQTTLSATAFDIYRRKVKNPEVQWESSNKSVASINASGVVTTIRSGFTIISAVIRGRTGSATITVGPKTVQNVEVTLSSSDIGVGEEAEASVAALDNEGNAISGASIAWQSGNPSIATVDADGHVLGITAGVTSISAISGGKFGSAPLRVASRVATSLQFNPTAPVVQVGRQGTISADVLDQNGHVMAGQASYTSLNPSIVSIDQQGVITGLSAGVGTLRASFGALVATTSATVTGVAVASIIVSPNALSLVPGGLGSLSASTLDANGAPLTGRSIAWSSNDPTVATVGANGKVSGVSQGVALITAMSEGKSASVVVTVGAPVKVPVASVAVTLNAAQLNIGESTQAVATLKDAAGNTLTGRTIQWSTSDSDLATVSSNGLVTAIGAGSVTILATSEGQSGAAGLSVNSAGPAPIAFFNLQVNTHSLAPGATTQGIVDMRDAAGNPLTGTVGFSSNKPNITKVDASGKITGVQAGESVVTASTVGFSDAEPMAVVAGTTPSPVLTTIALSAGSTDVQVGSTLQVTATPRDQNGSPIATSALTWSSANTGIATVNQNGLVTAKTGGSTNIRASVSGVVGSLNITVTSAPPPPPAPVAAITVSVSPSSVPVGQAALATVVLKDAQGNTLSGRIINYSSSNTAVATVATNGVISTQAAGSATISATSEGKTGSAALTVTGSAPPPPPPSTGTGPAALADLPQQWVNTTYVPPTGKTINVNAGDDLQAAINAAQRGDVIKLQAGASFTGQFVLPNKPGTGWITIRSAAPDANLPAAGQRITPAYASQLPKLLVPYNNGIVITTAPGASFYRLMFLEITAPASIGQVNSLVRLGDPGANHNVTPIPSNLIIDRSYIHGTATLPLVRCVLLSSAWTAVIDSHLSDCHANGFDSQAIVSWNGTGPFKINNNFLSAAGEVVMFGGATPATPGLIPADIEMRGNHFYKPAAWKNSSWSIKNLFEIKIGRRILFEGNVLDGNWQQSQTGYAINVKSSADFAWGISEHVTLRNNIIRNVGAGIVLSAFEGVTKLPANHITITNNVLDNVNTGIYNGTASLLTMLGDLRDVSITHNTMVSVGNIGSAVTFDRAPVQRLTFSNNILNRGQYGVKGSGAAEGTGTLNTYAPGLQFFNNVFISKSSNPYPSSTMFATNSSSVGFANLAAGDYTLTSSSVYKNSAGGGNDPGADIALVRSVTSGVIVP